MSNKVIAIMNNPSECKKCVFILSSNHCNEKICMLNGKNIFISGRKSDFCPLKPIPKFCSTEHVDYAHEASEINGWNKCLENILKDDLK